MTTEAGKEEIFGIAVIWDNLKWYEKPFMMFLKIISFPFLDEDSIFSWKKALTAMLGGTFVYSCLTYLWCNNGGELPTSYMYVIALVFLAYFGKDLPSQITDLLSTIYSNKQK